MSVPSGKNVSAKVFLKLSKYKDLEIEIANMWHMKVKTIPVVVGALGVIKKSSSSSSSASDLQFLLACFNCVRWFDGQTDK